MKAAELVEQVRGLDGRIAVWSHLLETAEQLRNSPHPPQMRGVIEEHIIEVAQEIEASIADLKTARDDLMDKDVK